MNAVQDNLEPETLIQLSDGQTEILTKALLGESYPATEAQVPSDTQIIKRAAGNPESQNGKPCFL